MEKIDFDEMMIQWITNELNKFKDDDERLRKQLMITGMIFKTDEKIENISTIVHNKIMHEINVCRKNNILFPIDYKVVIDLLHYFEHYYYSTLNESTFDLCTVLNEVNKKKTIFKVLNANKYNRIIFDKRKKVVADYNKIADYIYNFEISRDGLEVLLTSIDNNTEEDCYEVIKCHKIYHKKMNNTLVLSQLK